MNAGVLFYVYRTARVMSDMLWQGWREPSVRRTTLSVYKFH